MTIASEPPRVSVEYDGIDYDVTREGLAEILHCPQKLSNEKEGSQEVFYNPIQQFNRDLSVLAIRVFGEDFDSIRKQHAGPYRTHDKRTKKRKRGDDDSEVLGETVCKPLTGKKEVTHSEADVTKILASDQCTKQQCGNEHYIPPSLGEERNQRDRVSGITSTDSADVPVGPKHEFSLKILDALSASGLRALRYAKEIPQPTSTTANDLSPAAVNSIRLNVRHNDLANKVFPLSGSATAEMYRIGSENLARLPDGSRGKYHVIDLDPYGTAAPFLDAAVQAVQDGGLLCVTCTDAGVFASAGYPEKTFSQYGGLPLRGPHAHEGGLRLLLNAIATSAGRYGIAIEPLLSLSIDFYVRVFVRLRRSPNEVKLLAGKTIAVYSCDTGCGAWSTQPIGRTIPRENKVGDPIFKYSLGQAPTSRPLCEHCGFKTHLAGPMWGGPIQNPFFIQRILDLLPSLDPTVYHTLPRIEGMLTTARDETLLPNDLVSTTATSAAASKTSSVTAETQNIPSIATLPIPRLPPHLSDPHPFFVIPSVLAKVLHCVAPSHAGLRSALVSLGYRTTRSHTKAGSIRTDAPWGVLWEVMREWSRQHAPVKAERYKEGTAGAGIMRWSREAGVETEAKELQRIAQGASNSESLKKGVEAWLGRLTEKECCLKENYIDGDNVGPQLQEYKGKLKVIFDEAKGRDAEADSGKKLKRYQINPKANWGPMSRASGR